MTELIAKIILKVIGSRHCVKVCITSSYLIKQERGG